MTGKGFVVKGKTLALVTLWLAVVAVGGVPCQAQSGPSADEPETKTASVWQRGWYEDQGIELPRRFGVALNFISMERDIEVTDVTVKVGDRPPESIADRASLDVANQTTLTMARFDAFLTVFSGSYRF